ncbi:LysR family transcriptional regulator [Arhodomonas aquaeolei]|uniref:LysR family transcriptional regulator n=1 Tax=Arhodomonas aquaeolei TaxID=2369 RepID=UPI00037BE7E0|nr:LysR family transcriptional regulator [Arhodomonas aquaeolei]
MDTQNLAAFVAAAEYGSFSRAAEALELTQPAVSKRISGLEDRIGARLFDRVGRRVALTEAGETLLPRARALLVMVDDTRRALDSLSHDVTGRLTLATSHHVGLHRLPAVLRAFTRHYPAAGLDLRFLDSEQAYQGVLDGALELAVVTLAPTPDPALSVVPVWVDDLRFVCGPEHPLAGAGRIDLATLGRHEGVLPGSRTFTRGLIEERFARAGVTPTIALATNYLETLKMMASIGLGWSVLPETLLDGTLHVIDVDEPPIRRPLGYLYHRSRTLSNAARAMIAELETVRTADTRT